MHVETKNDWNFGNYLQGFDELNTLTTYVWTSTFSKTKEERKKEMTDTILSFLILAYKEGNKAINNQLWDCELDDDLMYAAVYKVIDGKTFEDRIAEHIENNNLGSLLNLVESEYHRDFNSAMYDGADSFESRKFREVEKEWVTMNDERVRDTHRYLEGKQVGLHERFYTYDGDSAEYPGDFSKAENNVNCRCLVLFRTS